MLLEHFTKGTCRTITGSSVGVEIETDFVFESGEPICVPVTDMLLSKVGGRPTGCIQKLELGRQKIELAIGPAPNFVLLEEMTRESLQWLYKVAAQHGAFPMHEPEFLWHENLLYVQEERDDLWTQLDGRAALEHLCRCSSVQFTVAVNPAEAIEMINCLWQAGLHMEDYTPNQRKWEMYILESRAGYRLDRYAGPRGFEDLTEYVHELKKHEVRMHQGRPVRIPVSKVCNLDVELFLRSVWWHYRLRRYGETLAIEIRPFARRGDEMIPKVWNRIASVLGL